LERSTLNELELQSIMLRDVSFIQNRTSNETRQTALVQQGKICEIVGCFFRSKSSWKYFPEKKCEIKAVLGADGIDFKWSGPFEMVVVFAVNGINQQLLSSADYDWRKSPLQLQWNQKIDGNLDVLNIISQVFNDNEIKGPKYTAPFYYLGYNVGAQGNFGHLKSGFNWNESQGLAEDEVPHHSEIDSAQIREILDEHILKNPESLKTPKCGSGYVYAGYFRFNYEIPGTMKIADALRPFGKVN
jgi:hypothetical protein